MVRLVPGERLHQMCPASAENSNKILANSIVSEKNLGKPDAMLSELERLKANNINKNTQYIFNKQRRVTPRRLRSEKSFQLLSEKVHSLWII